MPCSRDPCQSYAAAQLDAAPAYWETTVHAPLGDLSDTMLVDEVPTGSVLLFLATTVVSWFFHLPGFLLSYLLSGTHAGRYGSQTGLAFTFIEWGLEAGHWYKNDSGFGIGLGQSGDGTAGAEDGSTGTGSGEGGKMPTATMTWDAAPYPSGLPGGVDPSDYADMARATDIAQKWIAFALMTAGK